MASRDDKTSVLQFFSFSEDALLCHALSYLDVYNLYSTVVNRSHCSGVHNASLRNCLAEAE